MSGNRPFPPSSPSFLLPLAGLVGLAAATLGCPADDNADDVLEATSCSVLSTIASSATSSISGNVSQGGLESYGFSSDSSSNTTVTPPASSPCGNEMAQRLQGLCALCENTGETACVDALDRLFDMERTPIEACAACGDGICSPGESAREGDGDNTFCPEDCSGNCGDGECTGIENFACPEGAPADVCVVCQQELLRQRDVRPRRGRPRHPRARPHRLPRGLREPVRRRRVHRRRERPRARRRQPDGLPAGLRPLRQQLL